MREAEGQVERLPQLAAELIAAKPDVLVSAGPQPIAALVRATSTIPIVMAIVSDPVTYGYARSLSHPGGNLTGLSMVNTELSSKRIDLLRQMSPEISRLLVFTDPTMGPQGLTETAAAAHTLGLDLQVLPLAADKIEEGFAEAERARAQALLVMPTPFYEPADSSTAARKAGLAASAAVDVRRDFLCARRLPDVLRSGLCGYVAPLGELCRKDPKGCEPRRSADRTAAKFELVINLSSAKALGLTVPPILLAQADEIIE